MSSTTKGRLGLLEAVSLGGGLMRVLVAFDLVPKTLSQRWIHAQVLPGDA